MNIYTYIYEDYKRNLLEMDINHDQKWKDLDDIFYQMWTVSFEIKGL